MQHTKLDKKIRGLKFSTKSVKPAARAAGFTLIEVMVAMTIFVVIIIMGIGAVLDAIEQHYTSQNISTVMDNLNFVMEDMARNLRLSTAVHCELGTEAAENPDGSVIPQSCPALSDAHNKITFTDLTGVHDITYTISAPTSTEPSQIYKAIDDFSSGSVVPGAPETITPPEVSIDFAQSGFTVRGAEAGDKTQPTVVIQLVGTIHYHNVASNFAIQTTVELRQLDS